MLVLSCKRDEKVIIADGEIKVCVVEIRGDRVRLGFEADEDIPINREIVQKAIEKDRSIAEALRDYENENGDDGLFVIMKKHRFLKKFDGEHGQWIGDVDRSARFDTESEALFFIDTYDLTDARVDELSIKEIATV